MRSASVATDLSRGTELDLIELARWRARFEVGRCLHQGFDPEDARRETIHRFRDELNEESFGDYADEALMAAFQREVECAIGQSSF